MSVEQIEKPKNKFCFVKKLNLCSRKTKPELNYETIPYQRQMESPIRNQIEHNRIKLERFNILKKQTTAGRLIASNSVVDKQLPDFQSTQMEPAAGFSERRSGEFYYLNMTNKITSTVLQQSNSSILSEETDPSLSQISECSSSSSSSQYESPTNDSSSAPSYSSFEETQDFSSSFSSQEFRSVNSSFFEPTKSNVYVCCKPFVARIEGDMSLKYTDRVLVLHETETVFLVKNLLTNTCGYVPKQNLINLQIFLSKL